MNRREFVRGLLATGALVAVPFGLSVPVRKKIWQVSRNAPVGTLIRAQDQMIFPGQLLVSSGLRLRIIPLVHDELLIECSDAAEAQKLYAALQNGGAFLISPKSILTDALPLCEISGSATQG